VAADETGASRDQRVRHFRMLHRVSAHRLDGHRRQVPRVRLAAAGLPVSSRRDATEVSGRALSSLEREWALAKTWLYRRLSSRA